MTKSIPLFLVLFFLNSCASQRESEAPPANQPPTVEIEATDSEPKPSLTASLSMQATKNLELPGLKKGEILNKRLAYSFVFLKEHHIPKWVAYELTAEEASGTIKRTDDFRKDPFVEGSALPKDYDEPIYDQGHLAPAKDFATSLETMSESFLMTNMAPQTGPLNRGIINQLEDKVRGWAKVYGAVYIVTGPVITSGMETIGKTKVAVPKSFFKVVLEQKSKLPRAIGFVIPQSYKNKDKCSYAMTIDEVEKLTGIDFFPSLPDSIENVVEAKVDCASWPWVSIKAKPKRKATISGEADEAPSISLASDTSCPTGTKLMAATIKGCCRGHAGVAGPKLHKGCCADDMRVTCNDGTKSASCVCGSN